MLNLFLGLTLLSSFLLGKTASFVSNNVFLQLKSMPWNSILIIGITFCLTGLSFSLAALFLKKNRFLMEAILLNCLGFLSAFFLPPNFQSLGGILLSACLFSIFQYLFFKGVQERSEKFISFLPMEIFPSKITNFLLGLSLIFSLIFCLGLRNKMIDPKLNISEILSNQIKRSTNLILEKTFREGLKTNLGKNLEKNIGSQNPKKVLKFLRKEAQETAGEGTLRQKLGVKPEIFASRETILSNFQKKIQQAIKPFLKYLPIIALFSVFLILKFMVSLLMIFLPWILSLLFQALIKFNFLKLIEKKEAVKRISL